MRSKHEEMLSILKENPEYEIGISGMMGFISMSDEEFIKNYDINEKNYVLYDDDKQLVKIEKRTLSEDIYKSLTKCDVLFDDDSESFSLNFNTEDGGAGLVDICFLSGGNYENPEVEIYIESKQATKFVEDVSEDKLYLDDVIEVSTSIKNYAESPLNYTFMESLQKDLNNKIENLNNKESFLKIYLKDCSEDELHEIAQEYFDKEEYSDKLFDELVESLHKYIIEEFEPKEIVDVITFLSFFTKEKANSLNKLVSEFADSAEETKLSDTLLTEDSSNMQNTKQ